MTQHHERTSSGKLPDEKQLKQQAHDMSKATGEKRGHCYEAIAKHHGFGTYAAMRAQMKADGVIKP